MKKIITIVGIVLVIAAAALIFTDFDDRPVTYSEIPANAQKFVSGNFAGLQVAGTIKDWNLSGSEYTVFLSNGTKIDFDSSGEWKEIDCGMSPVPAGAIPVKIATYIKGAFPETSTYKIEKDRQGYEVKISNGFNLKFTPNQDFKGMDD